MVSSFSKAFIVVSAFTLIGCNGGEKTEDKQNQDEVSDSLKTLNDSIQSVTEEESDFSYNLPSALQLAYVFKKSNATFIPTLPNDKAKVANYNTTNFKRAINFGAYSSDLAYCLFNKKYQESKNYLKACKDLGSNLGINQAFESDNMAERFDKNITKEDSLVRIITSVQRKTDVLFEQNKQKHVTVVAFAGAWTESMYIACQVYTKEKNKKVLESCLEQLALAETLIKALTACEKSEPEIPNLLTILNAIDVQFKNIASVKSVIEKGDDFDFSTTSVTPDEFKAITESISALRKNIIE